MKLIVITTPYFFEGEAAAITSLFHAGLEILHLRKPGASVDEVESLLRQVPAQYRERIVTHEHFQLASSYGLKGIHLNRRHPQIPDGYSGHVSCSCHSLEEVAQHKSDCDYVFLSPIYDSISKEGYASTFTYPQLQQAQQAGIINSRVIALGGVSSEHLPEIASLGFGGAALLGDIWQRESSDLLPYFRSLLSQFFIHHS